MLKLKDKKGITLMTLIVIIIVIIIITAITFTEGTTLIKQTNVDNFKTNMISLRAKSKVIAEEVNSKVWDAPVDEKATKRQEIYQSEYYMEPTEITDEQKEGLNANIGDQFECYVITERTLQKMNLRNIKDIEEYVVVYNSEDYTQLDIVYKPGIKYKNTVYYTLTTLQTSAGSSDSENSENTENTDSEDSNNTNSEDSNSSENTNSNDSNSEETESGNTNSEESGSGE